MDRAVIAINTAGDNVIFAIHGSSVIVFQLHGEAIDTVNWVRFELSALQRIGKWQRAGSLRRVTRSTIR